jgi:putative aminopeptidase FrvX
MSGRAELLPAPRSRFVLPKRASGWLAQEQRERAMGFVRALIEPPTAPYFEDAQIEVVRAFVREHGGFGIAEDEHANLVVTWKGRGKPQRGARVLAFSAHLDHPGFEWLGVKSGVARARFHGGVPPRYFPGAPVRFFGAKTREACATARVKSVEREGEHLVAVLADVRGAPKRGSFGVFDLTSGEMRGTRLYARVCDDLMGAASILAMLDQLAREDHPRRVIGVFTRAEETGFVGCIGLLESKLLLREVASGLALIGLECSPRRATAKVGHGPVIRVGDKQSVFDPSLTLELQAAAARLRETHPSFRFQRALMDGGSCESTAYNLWGVRAGAMCLALGNYHNCKPVREGRDGGTIAPEFVDWNDFEGLIALMVQTARSFGDGDAASKMRARLQLTYEREYKRLADSARRIRAAPR